MSLRERKKQRTRRELIGAATRLFTEKGYEQTTVAEIAAAAEVSPKTLFSYFAGKDDILFADDRPRLNGALQVIADRGADEPLPEFLGRLADALIDSFGPAAADADEGARIPYALRLRLLLTVPELQARALQLSLEAQRRLAEALHDSYPDRIDQISAAGIVGALMGAAQTARLVSLQRDDSPEQVLEATRRAVDVALRGVLTAATAEPVDSDPVRDQVSDVSS